MTEEQTTVPESPKRSSASSMGMIIVFIFFLLFIAALGFGYFQIFTLNRQLSQLQENQISNQEEAGDIKNTMNSIQQNIQESEQKSAEQSKMMAEWQKLQSTDLNKWQAAHAYYLTRMANDQLQFMQNSKMAVTLLQQADKDLQASQDPALLEVRKSLASDLANLQTSSQNDVTEIFVRLYAIKFLIDKLPLPNSLKPAPEEKLVQTQSSFWKNTWESMTLALSRIVIIQRIDSKALPLMPNEKNYIEQVWSQHIDNAIWGLLHQNGTVYVTSLSQAQALIKQYYAQSPEAQQLSQKLQELMDINIQPKEMTVATTLQLFDRYFSPVNTAPEV